ncbi:uncharacterized protein LOC108596953 isoform X2 [Drosophila busckii]|nr:uncharacterized protein LOC108596953 isoform X2 [Drosophila busckii]
MASSKLKAVTNEAKDSVPVGVSATANSNKSSPQGSHRRKTQHTVRNEAETDMQFETIADEESVLMPVAVPSKLDDNLKTAIGNMLDSDDTKTYLQRLANERVRCNFLLATYQLPDINFVIGTPIETLQNEYNLRLRQRQERSATPGVEAGVYVASNPSNAPRAPGLVENVCYVAKPATTSTNTKAPPK